MNVVERAADAKDTRAAAAAMRPRVAALADDAALCPRRYRVAECEAMLRA